MSSGSRWKCSEEAISQKVDDETVIMDLGSECYYGLNGTGTRIWDLLSQEKSLDEIVTIICEEFRQPEDIVAIDVAELIEGLTEAGLISMV